MPLIDPDIGDAILDEGLERYDARDDGFDWDAFEADIATSIPVRPWPHTCSKCAREHSREGWDRLHFVGYSFGLQYRDCPCGNTLARSMPRPEAA